VKRALLQIRRDVVAHGYCEDVETTEEIRKLTNDEVSTLKDMLQRSQLEEEDIELVLALMVEHSDDVLLRFRDLLREFPNLAKNVYLFCRHIKDKDSVTTLVLEYLKETTVVPEFQLFWIGMMLEDHLLATKRAGDLVNALMNHPWATTITKAKVLEIATMKYGLPELRSEQLKGGNSDWLAWAAAVGSRKNNRASRNYVLNYFKNASQMNALIRDIISEIP
jgi:hypothetical protein